MKGVLIGVLALAILDVVVSSTSAASRAGSVGTLLAKGVSDFLSPTKPGLSVTGTTATAQANAKALKNYKPGTMPTTPKKVAAITQYVHTP